MSEASSYPTSYMMTFEEYDALPESMVGEYIDGEFRLAPNPTLGHQEGAHYLTAVLRRICRPPERVSAAWSWKPAKDEFHPDVMMVPEAPDEKRFVGTPLLCIEILSSNRSDDLVGKRAKYAAAGLRDYWVVDRRDRRLIRFELHGCMLTEVDGYEPAGVAVSVYDEPRLEGPGVAEIPFANRMAAIDLDYLFAL